MSMNKALLKTSTARKSQPLESPEAIKAAARFVDGKTEAEPERKRYSVFLQPEIHERLWKYWASLPAERRASLSQFIETLVVSGLDKLEE
jgi:hypothetical protein